MRDNRIEHEYATFRTSCEMLERHSNRVSRLVIAASKCSAKIAHTASHSLAIGEYSVRGGTAPLGVCCETFWASNVATRRPKRLQDRVMQFVSSACGITIPSLPDQVVVTRGDERSRAVVQIRDRTYACVLHANAIQYVFDLTTDPAETTDIRNGVTHLMDDLQRLCVEPSTSVPPPIPPPIPEPPPDAIRYTRIPSTHISSTDPDCLRRVHSSDSGGFCGLHTRPTTEDPSPSCDDSTPASRGADLSDLVRLHPSGLLLATFAAGAAAGGASEQTSPVEVPNATVYQNSVMQNNRQTGGNRNVILSPRIPTIATTVGSSWATHVRVRRVAFGHTRSVSHSREICATPAVFRERTRAPSANATMSRQWTSSGSSFVLSFMGTRGWSRTNRTPPPPSWSRTTTSP